MLAMFIPVLSNSKLCVHLVASEGLQEHVKKNNIKMVKKLQKNMVVYYMMMKYQRF